MKRIGIIGTDNGHAHMYSALINGWREDEPLPLRNAGRGLDPAVHIWGHFAQSLDIGDFGGRPPDMKVSRIWSEDANEAQRLARACAIDHISPTPAEATVDVDAVMVLSESPDIHFEHARPSLERGIPTYIDKPMAPNSKQAQEIFDFAEANGAPCFTGSSLRYSPELLAVRESQRRMLGDIRAAYIHCPISVPLYVSHALEMMNLFVGHDIEWVQAMGANDRQVVLLQEASSISVVIDHIHIGAHPRYSGALHGSDDYLTFTLTRIGATAFALVQEFARFAETGVAPCPNAESVAIVRLSEAIVTSLETGERVAMNERASAVM